MHRAESLTSVFFGSQQLHNRQKLCVLFFPQLPVKRGHGLEVGPAPGVPFRSHPLGISPLTFPHPSPVNRGFPSRKPRNSYHRGGGVAGGGERERKNSGPRWKKRNWHNKAWFFFFFLPFWLETLKGSKCPGCQNKRCVIRCI